MPNPTRPQPNGVSAGLKRLIGPMIAALAIDALDLMTYGPIGLYVGMIFGGALGYWLAPELGFSARTRWMCAAMTGLYCTLPLTGFLPMATVAAGVSRLLMPDSDEALNPTGSVHEIRENPEGSIEVEYEAHWDEPD